MREVLFSLFNLMASRYNDPGTKAWRIFTMCSCFIFETKNMTACDEREKKISYLSSCSSLSSLFGVSFKPPFLARGHPDKLQMIGDSMG